MSLVYGPGSLLLSGNTGRINWLADTIKAMLVTVAYTVNADHSFVSSAVAAELTGTGYVGGFGGAGRKTLSSKTLSYDGTLNRVIFDAADIVWTAINAGAVKAAILIKELTTDADSPVIAYCDGTALTTNGSDITLTFPATGCFYQQV